MVASSTPPVQEFIKNNTNGLLVDFFNTRQLANTVTKVLATQNSPVMQAMRQQARQSIITHCNPQTIANMRKQLLA